MWNYHGTITERVEVVELYVAVVPEGTPVNAIPVGYKFDVDPWKNLNVVVPEGGATLNETESTVPNVAVAVDAPVVWNARKSPVIAVCPV